MTSKQVLDMHRISGEVLEAVGVSKESLTALLCTAAIIAKVLRISRPVLLRALLTAYDDDNNREVN